MPADLVLVCGVFGNVSDADIERTVRALPTLCSPRATVIWTRHRRPPDRTVDVRRWFEAAGFEELAFVGSDEQLFGVGAHRLVVAPRPLVPAPTLFEFVGAEALR